MIWFCFGIAFAVLIIAMFSYYTFRICFYAKADRNEDPYQQMRGRQYEVVKDSILACTRKMDDTPCQWVHTRSNDGLTLYGRYYHLQDGAPLQIMFHGYRSMALRDCAGGHALGRKLGFNVLAVDQRAHARSGGRVITFGIRERYDCLRWVEYAVKRFGEDVPIVLSGLSMGAATVLMASNLELPKNVVAIMADCPYSDPSDIIRKVCVDEHFPDKLVYPFIYLGAKIFGGFDIKEANSTGSVAQTEIPILLIHGEDDRFVPCEMSRIIYSACASPAQLHTFPNAGHGLSYMIDPQRYERITVEFLHSLPALRPYLEKNALARNILNNANLYKK